MPLGAQPISVLKENIMETKSYGQPEDPVTGAIESQTSKLPSSGFLAFAIGAMAASALLRVAGKKELALFIGEWVPSILIMGVYNKLVKQQGSDVLTRPDTPPERSFSTAAGM
jgi:hypothetical protein